MASERGFLKGVLQNETVELETEMVVAIMKDVASALKYLHQLDPPSLAKDITSSAVVVNADYGAQLIHLHLATVRDICYVSICCCSMLQCHDAIAAVSGLVEMARWQQSLHAKSLFYAKGFCQNPGRVAAPIPVQELSQSDSIHKGVASQQKSYLPVRARLAIRKANQLTSLLAFHVACGAGYEYSKWVSQRNNFW